jgi:hypothetical protein
VNDVDRPEWCQDATCQCLTGYAGRICVGRLEHKTPHDDLFNTHNLCFDQDTLFQVNDADAYYLTRCLQAVRADVEQHNLYRPPGRGETWEMGGGK